MLIIASGGSILTTLLASDITKSHTVSVLMGGSNKAATFEKLGVKPILFDGFEDLDFV